MRGKIAIGFLVIALFGIWANRSPGNSTSPEQSTSSQLASPDPAISDAPVPATNDSADDSGQTFHGHPCTSDCSGHEAGYAWAESHDIDDEDDCDTAGDNSNSPSFAEGCRDYVTENQPATDKSDDTDTEDTDSDNAPDA